MRSLSTDCLHHYHFCRCLKNWSCWCWLLLCFFWLHQNMMSYQNCTQFFWLSLESCPIFCGAIMLKCWVARPWHFACLLMMMDKGLKDYFVNYYSLSIIVRFGLINPIGKNYKPNRFWCDNSFLDVHTKWYACIFLHIR